MTERRVLVLIPARHASSRFPGKPLALINGKSMIGRVYQNCSEDQTSGTPPSLKFEAYVVTDDQRIEDHVRGFGGNVIRVDDNVTTGSERIHLAYTRNFKDNPPDLVMNVQGDEPMLKHYQLVELAKFHLASTFDIATLVSRQTDMNDFKDPNNVKVIFSKVRGECLYFSRAEVPFDRDGNHRKEWYHHVGVYSYKPEALEKFAASESSYYEEHEKLEQLRALENGMRIGAVQIEERLMGVDVPEDIPKLEGVLKNE